MHPIFRKTFSTIQCVVASYSLSTVVLVGLFFTILSFAITDYKVRNLEARRLLFAQNELEDKLRREFMRVFDLLHMTRAFLSSKESVSREDFKSFLDEVNLRRAYPSVQSVGYIKKVSHREGIVLERQAREDGIPNYRIWPNTSSDYYFPVIFIEPNDPSKSTALGFDMHSEVKRAFALDKARDSGEGVISARVQLVQDGKRNLIPSFLLYLPIYQKGAELDTPENRQRALQGFSYSAIHVNEFLRELLRAGAVGRKEIAIKVYDGPNSTAEHLLFSNTENSMKRAIGEHFQAERKIHFFGRIWTIQFFALSGFVSPADQLTPILVLVAGLLLTALFSFVTAAAHRQLESERSRAAAEKAAREHLEGLTLNLKLSAQARERQMQVQEQLFELNQLVSAELDLEKVVQAVIDAATSLSQAAYGTFFYKAENSGENGEYRFVISNPCKESSFSHPVVNEKEFSCFISEGPTSTRSDDITSDPAFEKKHFCEPTQAKRSWIRSYMTVSVVSRSGDLIGGIFLGHPEPGKFTEWEEKIVRSLAAQASIAIENAQLFRKNQEAIHARDEFLSICSHELRTPLTSMKLQNQLVQRTMHQDLAKGNTARFEKMVLQSARQIDRLVALVEEMLDISRIRSGKLHMNLETLDLSSLVQETLERFSPQVEAARCTIHLRTPATLTGRWDKFRVEQVLINLLSNAIKYGAGKSVRVELSQKDDFAQLVVEDEGIGIAREHQERIFERFERAVSKNEISGLGLGLYIVKRILDLSGGRIRLESQLGKGSRFLVELPLS